MIKLIVTIILTLGIIVCYPNQVKIEYSIKKDSFKQTNNVLNENKQTNKINGSTDIEKQISTKKVDNFFKLDKNSILQDSVANFIGGVLFALLIFGLNEYVYRPKNISGEWETLNKVKNSTYNPHKGITIVYKVHLLQLGTQISGRGEKIKDLKADGSLHYEYPTKNRIEIEINGYYERNFLSRSKLYLLIKEYGTERVISTSFAFKIPLFKCKELTGNFISTASNSNGTTNWTKNG